MFLVVSDQRGAVTMEYSGMKYELKFVTPRKDRTSAVLAGGVALGSASIFSGAGESLSCEKITLKNCIHGLSKMHLSLLRASPQSCSRWSVRPNAMLCCLGV